MRIGEVARITGLSRDTIRFYEKRDLIEVKRTESDWNNYKDYDEENIRRLLLIKRCKGFGFTLNEISELLELVDHEEATCETLTDRMNQKLLLIDEKIRELEGIRQMITDKVDAVSLQCGTVVERKENCPEATVARIA